MKENKNFWAMMQRKKNLDIILKWIKQADDKSKNIDKQKLSAAIQMELGTSSHKAIEYIKLLQLSGNIKIDGDVITYTKGNKPINISN